VHFTDTIDILRGINGFSYGRGGVVQDGKVTGREGTWTGQPIGRDQEDQYASCNSYQKNERGVERREERRRCGRDRREKVR
jgi:hypothetical protein